MKTRTSHALSRLVLFASAWAMLGATPLPANPLEDWEALHPLPSGRTFFHGDGQWIGLRGDPQVSGDGEITHSADGLTWSKSTIPPDFRPIHAAYANGLWVVTGQEGIDGINMFTAILTSTDGIVWEKQNPNMNLWRLQNVNPWLRHVVYGNGLWMAMGSTGRYLTSTDGVNWTTRAIATYRVRSISYGNGRWLAFSDNGWGIGPVYVSTNGISWTAHELPIEISGVTFGDGQWAAIVHDVTENSIITSTDGIEWVTREIVELPLHLSGIPRAQRLRIAYGAGGWLVIGTERTSSSEQGPWRSFTVRSSDGLTWERRTIPTSPIVDRIADLISVNYGNGLWLLSGRQYFGNSELLSSSDALNWTPRTERVVGSFSDLTYGAGQWTGVGSEIATSPDGRTWKAVHSMTGSDLEAVAWGEGRWMASGHQWYKADSEWFLAGLILTSTNGSEWVPTLTNHGPNSSFIDIAYGAGLWVTVGYETVNDVTIPVLATSPNGLDWTKRAVPSSGGNVFDKVGFAEGRWIVQGSRWIGLGVERFMLTSTDAINWSIVEGIRPWGNMCFADGMWMIAGPTTLRSTNGTDWIARDLGVEFQFSSYIGSIVHVAGRWIISGSVSRGGEYHSALWVSADGEQWTEHLIGRKGVLLASDGKRLILTDGGEQIWVSGRLTPALPPSLSLTQEGSNFSLWLNGETGERYNIEQTLNLTPPGWTHLQSITLTNASQSIWSNPPTGASGFWRARTP